MPLCGEWSTEKEDRGERAVQAESSSLRRGGPDERQGDHQDDQRLGDDGRPHSHPDSDHRPRNVAINA